MDFWPNYADVNQSQGFCLKQGRQLQPDDRRAQPFDLYLHFSMATQLI